jgi:hypothetical protein
VRKSLKFINVFRVENAELLIVKAGGEYRYGWTVRVKRFKPSGSYRYHLL